MTTAAWEAPAYKPSRIGTNFSNSISNTVKQLPSRLGNNTSQEFIPQRAAIADNNTPAPAPSPIVQDTVQTPSAGIDVYEATGTKGIAGIGQAATNEVNMRVDYQRQQQQKEFDAQYKAQMQGATDKLNNAWANQDLAGQEGVSLSPKLGANGSASWINANNGKYHDFDGAFGAQCVDLYNFYMTGFVGGQSSVGQVNYAQELWGNHDRSALVQVAKNQKPQMGDIAIWSNSFNGMGGHVAIVAQDNGNGTIRVLNANATSAGPAGNTVMSNLSTGTLLGYLRPRKLM